MAVFNITTIADFTIVANTIDMLCTNYFKVTPFSGSPKKSVLSRRGLPSSSGSKRDLGDNNLSQQYLDDEGNFSPPPWSTAMFHHALFPYFSTCFIISTGASPVRPHCTTDHHGLVWVISTLPKWYYIDDGDNNFFWHVNHSSRLPCESSNWISSCVSTSQAMFSAINWRCALFFFVMVMKMPLQFYSYGNADFVDGMNQEVFTKSPRVCQRIFVCVIFFVSFKSLVFVFLWTALC